MFRQEKNQVDIEKYPEEDGAGGWVDFKQFERNVRHTRVTPAAERIQLSHGGSMAKLNIIPSLGIAEPVIEQHQIHLVRTGETDVSQTSVEDMQEGFRHLPMANTDELYQGDREDPFYQDVTGVDDAGNEVTGFSERNNTLDRT